MKVGITEVHGAYDELIKQPNNHVQYVALDRNGQSYPMLTSPIKGYFDTFDDSNVDIVESVISPIVTDKPWVYSLAVFQEALAFEIRKLPTPKFLRKLLIKHLLLQDNCKQLVFWSEAGLNTMQTYGGITDPDLLGKASVVYPSVSQKQKTHQQQTHKKFTFLFSGDFFRKGGASVVEAFEKLDSQHCELLLCCDLGIDFVTNNQQLKQTFLQRIERNPNITNLGRLPRDKFVNEILANADCYLLPSYYEAFGFALLEALSLGIPIIATNTMAFPEIVDSDSGLLIDISHVDTEAMFKGYTVSDIPQDFFNYMVGEIQQKMDTMLSSKERHAAMSKHAVSVATSKFSPNVRNQKMRAIYENCL